MNSTPQMDCLGFRSVGEHVDQRYAGALKRYLSERRYATHTVNGYLDCVAHFFQWAKRSVLDLAQIDETVVAHFLNDHLAHCNCGWPTRSDRADSSAALGHLLLVLWLGHENPTTTHRYVEADLAMKEKALARLEEPHTHMRRFRPTDALMTFLQQL